MNLYLISQDENIGYDTYDLAVVAAENEDIARNVNPCNGKPINWKNPEDTWCPKSENVCVKYIGKAVKGTVRGVICASFNAG